MGNGTGSRCGVCRKNVPVLTAPWTRRLPSYRKLALCHSCHARIVPAASDRAANGQDELRLAGLQRVLAGEVWSTDAGVLWFRTPFYHALDDAVPTKKVRKPNRADEVRKFLDSPYYANG